MNPSIKHILQLPYRVQRNYHLGTSFSEVGLQKTGDWIENFYLKGELTNFFICSSDAPKYDIIWTENEFSIDRFLPEIFTFKECSKWRDQHVFDTLWT